MALQHAKLGASSATRWIACPGSIRLIDSLPEPEQRRSSVYADEGNAAHSVVERCLLKGVRPKSLKGAFVSKDGVIIDKGSVDGLPGSWFEVDDEMVDAAQVYLDEVDYHLDRLGRESCEVYVEVLAQPIPGREDLFGTADVVIVEPGGELVVVDFKYGKGVVVEPTYNDQCMYYALGAVHKAGGPDDVEDVTIVVVQPRAPHSDGPVRRWGTTTDELMQFGETLVAAAARVEDPNAPRVPGEHCRFCPAASHCPELSQQVHENVVETLPDDLEDETPTVRLPDPNCPRELAKALQVANLAEYWAKEVVGMAQAALESGTDIPGYKLVRGRSHRRWALDEEELVKKLRNKGLKNEDIFTRKVRSPAQIEKVKQVGKDWVKRYAEKPEGKKTIAPVDDPREAVRPEIAAFANEED